MSISFEHAKNIYRWAIEHEEWNGKKSAIFYLKDSLNQKLNLIQSSFPESTFHSIAVKTNAHIQVLKHIVSCGFGLEAASFGEVMLAKNAGAANKDIVFDSPVKTYEEINKCHLEFPGITLNANSLQELWRYPSDFFGNIGLRINPMEKSDAPDIFNLSDEKSKFGVPFNQYDKIINACMQHRQVTGLHMHIGSRINDFSKNVSAVKKIKQLADDINSIRFQKDIPERIEFIDIGGGIDFNMDKQQFSIGEFVRQLKNIEGLFENYRIITEYGNFVHRKNSFVASNVEYVVDNGQTETSLVYIHVGADLFVRKVYTELPEDYPVCVVYADDRQEMEREYYRIVGPLCFEGDILFDRLQLPKLQEHDKLLIMNTGSNTNSMWSRHCNRVEPEFIFI